MAQLKDYVIVQPKSKVKAGEGLIEGKYKFFTSSNTQTKWLNEFYYDKPALILGTGGMASVHYCDTPFSTSTDCIVMYAKDSTNLEYIYHYLESHMEVLEDGFKGAGLKHISKDYILNIQIPEKELLEQKKIVDLCNNIDLIVAASKKQLEKLDELVKSRFVELFGDPKLNEKGWDCGVISDFFDVKGGKRIPKGMGYSNIKTNHPYLRATDMKNETIIEDDIRYIDEDVFQHIKRYTVKGGDIYLTNVGVHLGMAGVIPEKFDGANLTENAVKLVPKTKGVIDGLFLSYYINSPGIQEYIDERKMSVGVPKLAIFRIESMPLLIPPMNIQKEFISFAKQINKSKFEVQQSLDKLETLKKSLMQQYFG